MEKRRFAHDVNLGFPFEERDWIEFIHRYQMEVVGYDDMAKLTEELKAHHALIGYLPVANQFYLRTDPFYEGVATALSGGKTTFKSLLIVKKESPIQRWDQLEGKRLGFIHRFCTSSYFGCGLFLAEKSASLKRFFSEIIGVGAWQKQIDAVVAGRVEATMVMEAVWLANPKNRETTRIIDSQDGLPCPSVVIDRKADSSLKTELLDRLLVTRGAKNSLFSGFVPYQKELVEGFFKKAEKAI